MSTNGLGVVIRALTGPPPAEDCRFAFTENEASALHRRLLACALHASGVDRHDIYLHAASAMFRLMEAIREDENARRVSQELQSRITTALHPEPPPPPEWVSEVIK